MTCYRDRNFDWARHRVFRGAHKFAQFVTGAAGPVDSSAGASTLVEMNNKGIAGMKVTATTDLVLDYFPTPWDYDVTLPSYWRVLWTADTAATTKTLLPVLKYSQLSNGSAIAAGTTALDTAIAKDTTLGAYKLHVSPWGKMNADKLTGGKLLSISIQADGSVTTKTAWILGYEFEYTPQTSGQDVGRMEREGHRRLTY